MASYSPQTLLVISLSVAVVFISILAYFLKGTSSTKRSTVLLLGPSGGGKTAILTTLLYGQTLPTQTSIQTNISSIEPSADSLRKGPVKLVDVPGHPRLRDDFRIYLETTKAVIFVVDSSTITRNAAAVAEHLHQVLHTLTSLPPTRTPPSLCILAHKADLIALPTSTPSSSTHEELAVTRVRTILERELDRRRLAQVGGVGMDKLASPTKGGDGEEDGEALGMSGLECRTPGGAFKFEDWEGGEATLLGSYVKLSQVGQNEKAGEKTREDDEKDGLAQLRAWFDDL